MNIFPIWTKHLLTILLFTPGSLSLDSVHKSDRLSNLVALSKAGRGVAPLNDKLFDEIISGPRNFSVALVLTALGSQFQCQPCHIFDVEYHLIGQQWAKQPPDVRNSHFFAMLDFKEGKKTFERLGLNTAPQARLYLPTAGPNAVVEVKNQVVTYDFNAGGHRALTAEQFSDWAIKTANLPKFFTRPPNYGKIFAGTCVVLASIILVKVAWPVVKVAFNSRFVWAAALLPLTLLMISGQMWCQIRSPPYMARTQNGSPSYIAGGYSNQFGVETQVIASLYGILAFAAYTLAFTVAKLDDPVRQRIAVYVWLGVYMLVASMLLNIFRMKNRSYPFKFFF